ncbi:MAG TPA: NADH-quinone oxidoreductase subunit C [Clostridia bacterium]|nr:NADH-quinone oxidoreductase subunit C [Clostridia bacterium]
MIDNVKEITVQELLGEVQKLHYEGYRFVTITCVDNNNDTLDLLYHFDKDYKLTNLRLTITKGTAVPSISKILFCALLVENEIKELFGVNIENLVVDYGGHLLLSDGAPDNPMLRQQITIVKKGEDKNA